MANNSFCIRSVIVGINTKTSIWKSRKNVSFYLRNYPATLIFSKINFFMEKVWSSDETPLSLPGWVGTAIWTSGFSAEVNQKMAEVSVVPCTGHLPHCAAVVVTSKLNLGSIHRARSQCGGCWGNNDTLTDTVAAPSWHHTHFVDTGVDLITWINPHPSQSVKAKIPSNTYLIYRLLRPFLVQV